MIQCNNEEAYDGTQVIEAVVQAGLSCASFLFLVHSVPGLLAVVDCFLSTRSPLHAAVQSQQTCPV